MTAQPVDALPECQDPPPLAPLPELDAEERDGAMRTERASRARWGSWAHLRPKASQVSEVW